MMNKDKIREELLFSEEFIEIVLNFSRTSHCIYQHGDGHGIQNPHIISRISKLLFEPLIMHKNVYACMRERWYTLYEQYLFINHFIYVIYAIYTLYIYTVYERWIFIISYMCYIRCRYTFHPIYIYTRRSIKEPINLGGKSSPIVAIVSSLIYFASFEFHFFQTN